MSKREYWIDALKGFTIIAVIIGHCLDGYLKAGMFEGLLAFDIFEIIKSVIYAFHMPLFFIISGYTLNLAYIDENNSFKTKRFFRQATNIMLIYVMWALMLWVVKMMFSKYVNDVYGVSDLIEMFITPLGNYWYLHALFILYLIVFIFKFNKTNKTITVLIMMLFSVLVLFFNEMYGLHVTVYKTAYHLAFFYIGMYLCRYREKLESKPAFIVSLLFTVAAWIVYATTDFPVLSNFVTRPVLALSMSYIFIFIFKTMSRFKLKFLNTCGKYCIYIYLIHPFITAGNRVILPKLYINEPYLALAINSLSALLISLVIAMMVEKIKILDLFFRPMSFVEMIREKTSKKKVEE